jgi:type VI secretion system secreted protein VgrG
MAVTQKYRAIQVISPLGEDALLFYRMNASERLGTPFEYELELLSPDLAIAPEKLLGQGMTVRLLLPDDSYRHFHGYVSRFGQYGTLDVYAHYRATLRPWLWFLTRASNCRIFQEKTVPDIIKQVFRDQGFSDFEERLSGSYPTREYCVQYRETDFNFVSRVMEEEGIYYYFRHEKDRHILVFADSANAHGVVPGYQEIPFFEPGNIEGRKRDHIFDWTFAQEVQPGAYALTDYDFKKPKANLQVKSTAEREHAMAAFECFDYPGQYLETSDGDNYVRCRVEELQAQFDQATGHANARGLMSGALFKFTDFPRRDQNREYLVTAASYQLLSDEYFTGQKSADQDIFRCTFTAIASTQTFRPPRVTSRPIVQGPQTAVVTGKAGEEIWTDQYGRVKVQFHWDRYGKRDENSSCWVRVSHPWAGKGWGAISIPRIGQEVIVDFLEGDPDQPIITGRVYNADVMPPFGLPGGAVVSGIKSSTHKGQGYNEMSMDDTAGKEKITIHGQYDMNTTVEHDKTTTVKNNRSTTVVVDDTLNVNSNRTVHVKGKLSETIDTGQEVTVSSGYKETITGGATSTISGGLTSTVNGQWENTVNGHLKEAVTAGEEQEVTGGKRLTVTGELTETVTGPINQSATATIGIHANGPGTYTSDASLKLAVAGSVVDITPAAITISAAGSTIKVDAAGVSINGAKISLNG